MQSSRVIHLFFLLAISLLAHGSLAKDVLSTLRENYTFEAYFQVDDQQGRLHRSLLAWTYHQDPSYQAPEDYKRTKHYSGWIKDPSHQTCFDTRNLVLLRQSIQPITYDPTNACKVLSSSWYDPYSDEYLFMARDIHVDHVVPLKNAYLAGAAEWSKAKRCHYENFIDDPTHLIAVSKFENLSKGERGPERYLPLNSNFQCGYLAIWLRIKAIWRLKIAVVEAEAIRNFIRDNECPQSLFELNADEFEVFKRKTQAPPEACLTLQ
ncbi:MAG: hypothetical protein RJB66_1262 [Pseudomonadota bacterium]|jgi:hypothetical protein